MTIGISKRNLMPLVASSKKNVHLPHFHQMAPPPEPKSKEKKCPVAQATSKKISGIEGLSPAKGFIDGIPHNHPCGPCGHTLDGSEIRSSPADVVNIPSFTGFDTSQNG